MTKTASDPSQPGAFGRFASTLKAIGKTIILSRSCRITPKAHDKSRLIILGNGPSLNRTISEHLETLRHSDLMAVNFAAKADIFFELKPRYYVLADPHFFDNDSDPNVVALLENLKRIDWPMTLFIPRSARKCRFQQSLDNLSIEYYNAVGIEGNSAVCHALFHSGRAMPRPRNVLIPSIMIAIWLGYKEIYLTGADHNWTKTLSVDDDNNVVSIQPHFYEEDRRETERVRVSYMQYPLHRIVHSFYLAFRAYHEIASFAKSVGVKIYNATPGSFIDAFPRKSL